MEERRKMKNGGKKKEGRKCGRKSRKEGRGRYAVGQKRREMEGRKVEERNTGKNRGEGEKDRVIERREKEVKGIRMSEVD